jgi:hypothetical protein
MGTEDTYLPNRSLAYVASSLHAAQERLMDSVIMSTRVPQRWGRDPIGRQEPRARPAWDPGFVPLRTLLFSPLFSVLLPSFAA